MSERKRRPERKSTRRKRERQIEKARKNEKVPSEEYGENPPPAPTHIHRECFFFFFLPFALTSPRNFDECYVLSLLLVDIVVLLCLLSSAS